MLSIPVVDTLIAQALQLPEAQRGELVAQLLRSLEAKDDEQLLPGSLPTLRSSCVPRCS